MKSAVVQSFVVVTLLGAFGCASGPRVQYEDPHAVETLTADFGGTDIRLIVEDMVASLTERRVFGNDRPVIWVYPVRNRTSEHINTKMITDRIQTELVNSGIARFTAAADIPKELQDQLEYQSGSSGIVDPNTAQQKARQIAAKYALYGELGSIVKSTGDSKLVYYQITLKLTDFETGIVVWTGGKEISKSSARRLVGW